MLGASVNDQIEVVFLVQSQCLAHSTRFIWIPRYVHLCAIWTEQILYSPSSSVHMSLMMVMSRRCICGRRSAVNQGRWSRGHCNC